MEFMHRDDYNAIVNIIGDMPKQVEEEYLTRIRMKHRGGTTGRMGIDGIVAMLRFLKFEPPEVVGSQNHRTDWRVIEQGSAVTVFCDNKEKTAEFVTCTAAGMLAIRFPDETFIYEFPTHSVKLVEVNVPEDLDLDSLMVDDVPLDARQASFEEEEVEQLPSLSLENDWGAVEKGSPVLFGEDEDQHEAEFVSVGPSDFEVTIMTKSGDEITLPEAAVSIKGD